MTRKSRHAHSQATINKVIKLRDEKKMSFPDIAERLNLKSAAAASSLYRRQKAEAAAPQPVKKEGAVLKDAFQVIKYVAENGHRHSKRCQTAAKNFLDKHGN